MTTRSRLRLLADDLTGALDTAAELAPLSGGVRVAWREGRAVDAPALAIDTATREIDRADAVAKTARVAAEIGFASAEIAYFKVDSLLRGHAGHELSAVIAASDFDAVVIAPAFPFQHRRTLGGRQMALRGGVWQAAGEDIAATLESLGHDVSRVAAGTAVAGGVAICDAATDSDLAAIVASGRAFGGRLLWCGSGGLAAALAADAPAAQAPAPRAPLLGLFGTDHPVTVGQLRAVGDRALRLSADDDRGWARIETELGAGNSIFASLDLPPMSRSEARNRIGAHLGALARHLPAPASFVCGGGETLRAVCEALGVQELDVVGRLIPGVPVSRMRGGRWDGCLTISKSGAFGDDDFLARLLAGALSSSR